MRHRVRCSLVLLVGGLFIAGCDSTTPTTPTPPPATVTETFSGNLTLNGATTYPFVTQAAGTVTATLVRLEPTDTAIVGLSLGTWNTTTETCHAVMANDGATQSAVLSGTTQTAANLCVRVYDSGSLTEPAAYTIEVLHP